MRFVGILVAGLAGCGSCRAPAPVAEASPPAAPEASVAGAPLSLPIAAAATSDGAVLVAGLVAARKTIVAEHLEGDRVAFVVDVATGVDWSADLELRVLADNAGGGVVIARSASLKQLRRVDAKGGLGDAKTPGSAVCATERGLAEVAASGEIVLRGWGGEEIGRAAPLPDHDPVLICGRESVFVMAEGESDVLLLRVPSKGAPLKIVPDTDDERERAPFTAGDMLGVVEVTRAGAPRVIRVTDGAPRSAPIKRLMGEDDDLESVDGDERVVYLALSHDAAARCSGATATDLSVLRATSEGEQTIRVFEGECGKDLGPLRLDRTSGGALLAWAERSPKKKPNDPPIDSVGFAQIAGETAKVTKVPAHADGFVFAGCAHERCFMVLLDRAPGTDGMTPGVARVVSYP